MECPLHLGRDEWTEIKSLETELATLARHLQAKIRELKDRYILRPATDTCSLPGKMSVASMLCDRDQPVVLLPPSIEEQSNNEASLLEYEIVAGEMQKSQQKRKHDAIERAISTCPPKERALKRNFHGQLVQAELVGRTVLVQLAMRVYFETNYIYKGLANTGTVPVPKSAQPVPERRQKQSSSVAKSSRPVTASPLAQLFSQQRQKDPGIPAVTASNEIEQEEDISTLETLSRSRLLNEINCFLKELGLDVELHANAPLWRKYFLGSYLGLSDQERKAGRAFLVQRIVQMGRFRCALKRMLDELPLE